MIFGAKKERLIDSLIGGRIAILVLAILTTCFWWPALWKGLLIIHGDSAHHGLMLLLLHGQALAGHDSLLWANRIWGGHPHFAESQGGFADPLNIFVAWFFEPVYGWGVLHWLDMLVGGAGVYVLCRILGISRWSATFASVVVIFSSSWMRHQDDLPAFDTLTWLPWLIAAMEYWIKQPTFLRASLMAIPAALLVFAGYPQITYGAALYAVVSLPVQLFEKESRAFTLKHGLAFLVSGFLALVLAIGLSAIQFLPLMELVGESYRSEGVALSFGGFISPIPFLRGLFFFYLGGNEGMNDPNLSNMVAVMLSGLLVFLRAPVRIYGHLLGIFLLFNFGMGPVSPLFRILYEYHMIPGLHNFRATFPFYPVAVLGSAVVAANVLDTLSGDIHARLRSVFQKHHTLSWVAFGIYAVALTYLVCRSYMPAYSRSSFLAPGLVVLAFLWLCLQGSRRWFPLLAVLILAVDIVALRVDAFNFFDRKILEEPPVVHAIAVEPDVQDFRVMDESFGGFVTFFPPKDPNIGAGYRRLLKTLSPFPMALQWKVPTINGVTALPLSRNILIMPTLKAEVLRGEMNPSGLRLLDIFGIRYISRDESLISSRLTLYAKDSEQGVFIYRNNYAKPRFQVYWNAEVVDTPEQALAGLKVAQSEKLFIERHRGEHLVLPVACTDCAVNKPAIEVIEAQAMRYRMNVNMPREGWLFLADANYPGWEATVNGKAQPVYSAQVLGKAVRLQAGRNEVTIRYVPWSFYIGAAVSAMTLLVVLLILFKRR